MSVPNPFWTHLRHGDPFIVNAIRDGKDILDFKMFKPIKRMLDGGIIKPSEEAVSMHMTRAQKRIDRARSALIQIFKIDCYNAMVESAQAIIMATGNNPPPPRYIADELKDTFGKINLIDKEKIANLDSIVIMKKNIEKGDSITMDGKELEMWLNTSQDFVDEMKGVRNKLVGVEEI